MHSRGNAFHAALLCLSVPVAFCPSTISVRGQQPPIPLVDPVPANPSERQAQIDKLQSVLAEARKSGDSALEAKTLLNLAFQFAEPGQSHQAIDALSRAVPIFEKLGDRLGEGVSLQRMAETYLVRGDIDNALYYCRQAFPYLQGYSFWEPSVLELTARAQLQAWQLQSALDGFTLALHEFQSAPHTLDQWALPMTGQTMAEIGQVSFMLGDTAKGLNYFNQGLGVARQIGNRTLESMILNMMGGACLGAGEGQHAIKYFQQASEIRHAIGDRTGEALSLTMIGTAYLTLGNAAGAMDFSSQALVIVRAIGDRINEGMALQITCTAYELASQHQKAVDSCTEALALFRHIGDRKGEATVLAYLGNVSGQMGKPKEALAFLDEAVTISREVGDRQSEATALLYTGGVYSELGQSLNALAYFNQASTLVRALPDSQIKSTLMAISAPVLAALQEPMIGTSQAAAPCPPLVGQICEIVRNLGNGFMSLRMKNPQSALGYFDQMVSKSRELNILALEASGLEYKGLTYYLLNKPQSGHETFTQALTIAGQTGNPMLQSGIFYVLMGIEMREKPALAVFYGKQSLILVQQLRANIRDMDKETQKRFLESKSKIYHDLANLLIDQGRLAEAQQVLDLLKQQEYTDYVRSNPDWSLGSIALTPAEQQAEEEYRTVTAGLAAQGQRWNDLKQQKSRRPEEEKEFQQLSDTLARASQGLNDYYNRLYKLFGQGSEANRQLADVKGDLGQLRQVVSIIPHTVALYTLVSQDRVSIIVVTGSTAVARSSSISETDLYRKIAALQQALRDPRSDPRPAAQDLYNVLVAPVKADLEQVHAGTLVWSLDGVLRYIPMAALFDGRQYLVESYNNVTITPASISHLDQKPAFSSLYAAAMGISRQYERNLPALPGVATELSQIVRGTQGTDVPGVLPGTILLNDAFTQKEMEIQLARLKFQRI
jgi:tetratricopeptide (TPR) repeat protein